MAAIKIDKKTARSRVQKAQPAEEKAPAAAAEAAPVAKFEPAVEMTHDRQGRSSKVVRMTEEVQRPEMLVGSTYKIKTPVSDHAMYVTINDIVLNEDTPYEQRRPFEIFINSKNLDHYQWIVALTRIMSAVFRKGGDVTFLVEELRSGFDPRGGYFKKGGKYMPSLVGEIGDAIECHMRCRAAAHRQRRFRQPPAVFGHQAGRDHAVGVDQRVGARHGEADTVDGEAVQLQRSGVEAVGLESQRAERRRADPIE